MLKILFILMLLLNVVVADQEEFPIIDKSELERRSLVKYHLYDPQLFDMYTECITKLYRPCYSGHDFKHSLDVNFIEAMIALNQSVDPWDATLFIIPVLYDQVDGGPKAFCHSLHAPRLVAQMYEVLHSLGYYKPGVRNHFVMADHYSTGHSRKWVKGERFKFKPELIVGKFEQPALSPVFRWTVLDIDPSQYISVGYTTWNGLLRHCSFVTNMLSPLSIHNRTYLVSFAGGVLPVTDVIQRYLHRNVLLNYTWDHSIPNDTLISIYDKRFPIPKTHVWLDGNEVIHKSLLVLHLSGDTPTTDRIWTAFEYLSLVGVLTREKDDLLALLPFPDRVPWEDIFVWIDTDAFLQSPVEAVREAALALTESEKERRYNLMRKHRRDVLWGYNESVAVFNVLDEAASRVKTLAINTTTVL